MDKMRIAEQRKEVSLFRIYQTTASSNICTILLIRPMYTWGPIYGSDCLPVRYVVHFLLMQLWLTKNFY